MLAMGFREGHAVIHRAEGPGAMSLLHGDGSVASDAVIEVLVMDELAFFAGDFILRVEHAWQLVQEFARTGRTDTLGVWYGL